MRLLLQLLYFSLLGLILFLALSPDVSVMAGSENDKVNHFAAFITLALFARLLWPRTHILLPFLWLTALGAGIEILQGVMGLGREADFRDLAVNVAATAAGLMLAQGLLVTWKQQME